MFKKIIRIIKFTLSCAAAGAVIAAAGYLWLGSDHAGKTVSKLLSQHCKSDISVERMSGNYFNKAIFSGLSMSARAGGEKRSGVEIVKARSASVKYSLLDILWKQKLIIQDFDLNNMSVNFVDIESEAMIEPSLFINSVKKTIADLFYGRYFNVYIDKINIDRLRLAFDTISKTAGGTLDFTGLKIIPTDALMNAYQFESSLEAHRGRNLVIPAAAVKGEINLSKMSMKVLIEAERVNLANFNWLLKRCFNDITAKNGNMFISAVINYSPATGFQIYGSASAKNLSLAKAGSAFKIDGDAININFNENSLKITDSIFRIEDIPFNANGTISDIFSKSAIKTVLNLKSLNGGAGKYFEFIKKYGGFGDSIDHYYSTGFIDSEIKIDGIGTDYNDWARSASFIFKNVDIASQKISLAVEGLSGRIEGDSNGFKTRGPLLLKIAGRWHELNGEIKNHENLKESAYNFTLKEYSPSFYNDHLISNPEDHQRQYFVVFDYDETDESWGGAGWLSGASSSPFASIRANFAKNKNGYSSSLNAKFENICIDGLLGLKETVIGAELITRNGKTALNNLIVRLPHKTMLGDFKIFSKSGIPFYSLNLKDGENINKSVYLSNAKDGYGLNSLTPAAENIIKLAGALESFETDIKPYLNTDVIQNTVPALKDLSTNRINNNNTFAPGASGYDKSQEPDKSALDLGAADTSGLLKL